MGPQALQRRLHMMGIEVSMAEAQNMQSAWRKRFKKVAQWLDQESANGMRGNVPQTIFGRKRRFVIRRGEEWKVRNEARNFKIQSVASDLVLHALMRIDEEIHFAGLDQVCSIVNTVHDSIVLEVIDDAGIMKQVKDLVLHNMEAISTEELGGAVPLKADFEVGYSYAMEG